MKKPRKFEFPCILLQSVAGRSRNQLMEQKLHGQRRWKLRWGVAGDESWRSFFSFLVLGCWANDFQISYNSSKSE